MSMWMIFRTLGGPTPADASGICGSRIILPPVATIWSAPSGSGRLKRLGLVPRSAHPDVVFLQSGEDDRHRLRGTRPTS